MRGLAPEKSKLRSDINVTPLIDVCLVLLIVFMVVTPLITSERREVELPAADDPEKQPEEPKPFPVWIVFADPPGILAGPDARKMDSSGVFRGYADAPRLQAHDEGRGPRRPPS